MRSARSPRQAQKSTWRRCVRTLLGILDYGTVNACTQAPLRPLAEVSSPALHPQEVVVCPLKRGPEDNKDNAQMAYTPAVDVWSLGALMYEVLVGFTPFPGGPPPRNGGGPAAQLRFPSSVCEPARALVRSCLQLHPGDRPTVHELLRHEWVVTSLVSGLLMLCTYLGVGSPHHFCS